MERLLPLLAAIAFVVVVYRKVAARCRDDPSRRIRFIVGALAALGLGAALIPWVLADLKPPWSESPAGIFVYLGKAAVAGSLLLAGLGALIGALAPGRADAGDPG